MTICFSQNEQNGRKLAAINGSISASAALSEAFFSRAAIAEDVGGGSPRDEEEETVADFRRGGLMAFLRTAAAIVISASVSKNLISYLCFWLSGWVGPVCVQCSAMPQARSGMSGIYDIRLQLLSAFGATASDKAAEI